MAASPKMIELLESLLEATERGRLQWSETAYQSSFELKMPEVTIVLREEYDAGSGEYSILVRNEKGNPIDYEFLDPKDERYELIAGLYDLVRRKALRIDEQLERVIAKVNSLKK